MTFLDGEFFFVYVLHIHSTQLEKKIVSCIKILLYVKFGERSDDKNLCT